MTAPRLVLASTSRHRRGLLQRLGIAFEVRAPGTDESRSEGEAPAALALRLAREKAHAVAADCAGDAALVIGSDQVAELDGQALGKPGTAARCRAQLLACSGRTVRFHTGLAIVDARDGRCEAVLEPFCVHFRTLDPGRVARYVALEAPLDAAGGFYAEGLGITLFRALEGRDPNALVGLPLIAFTELLERFGLDLLDYVNAAAT